MFTKSNVQNTNFGSYNAEQFGTYLDKVRNWASKVPDAHSMIDLKSNSSWDYLSESLVSLRSSLGNGPRLLEKATGWSAPQAREIFGKSMGPTDVLIAAINSDIKRGVNADNFDKFAGQMDKLKSSLFQGDATLRDTLGLPAKTHKAEFATPSLFVGGQNHGPLSPDDEKAIGRIAAWLKEEDASGVFVPFSEYERKVDNPWIAQDDGWQAGSSQSASALVPNVGSPGFFEGLELGIEDRSMPSPFWPAGNSQAGEFVG